MIRKLVDRYFNEDDKYVEMFGTSDHVYTLNIGKELQSEMDSIYKEFSIWLGSWEM